MTSVPRAKAFFAVVNPAAGGGRCGKRAPSALGLLRDAGLEVIAHETACPRDGTRLVRRAWAEGFRRFLAVGGDGTAWEVLNGLMPLQLEVQGEEASLGFLPLGTGNSFLRDFSSEGAVRALIEGHRRPCDVLCLHHREGRVFSLNLMGWGFVTDVATRAQYRKRWGALGYVLAVLQSLLRFEPPTVSFRYDDKELSAEPATLICVCNSRYTGGAMMMAPHAQVDDGMADLIRAEPLSRWAMLRALPRIFRGTHLQDPAISSTRIHRIEIATTQPLPLMIDGEILKLIPKRIEVLPRILEIWA